MSRDSIIVSVPSGVVLRVVPLTVPDGLSLVAVDSRELSDSRGTESPEGQSRQRVADSLDPLSTQTESVDDTSGTRNRGTTDRP